MWILGIEFSSSGLAASGVTTESSLWSYFSFLIWQFSYQFCDIFIFMYVYMCRYGMYLYFVCLHFCVSSSCDVSVVFVVYVQWVHVQCIVVDGSLWVYVCFYILYASLWFACSMSVLLCVCVCMLYILLFVCSIWVYVRYVVYIALCQCVACMTVCLCLVPQLQLLAHG